MGIDIGIIHIAFRQQEVGCILHDIQLYAGIDSGLHFCDDRIFFLFVGDTAHLQQLDLVGDRTVGVRTFVYFKNCFRQADEFVFPFDAFPVESSLVDGFLGIVQAFVFLHFP